jgi:prepilin-type N-terminal cleavage/methylation domain-containing protein
VNNYLNLSKKKTHAGLTLLELLIAVGIAAVIAMAGIVIFRSVDKANKVRTEINHLQAIDGGVVSLYAAQGNYNGLDNGTTAIPEDMRGVTFGDVNSAWMSGGVYVLPFDTATEADGSFYIVYAGLNNDICVDLATKAFPIFKQIYLASGSVLMTGIQDAADNCNAGDRSNVIYFLHNDLL